jgi:hypothetical protein
MIQAKNREHKIRQAIFKNEFEDDDTGNRSSTIILVDGNNIRNSFGFQTMSALQLTKKMSFGIKTGNNKVASKKPQIICVWDGGSKRSSQKAFSTLIGYSGPDGTGTSTADDIIVQCCAFLSSSSQIQSMFHDNIQDHHLTVVVFTSDANLANRCQLQLTLKGEQSPRIDYQIYHSIYLRLLLGDDDDDDVDGHDHDHVKDIGANRFTPDWEREERRQSVEELQDFVEQQNTDVDVDVNNDNDQEYMNCIGDWINGGLKGLEIGRVTKGGSILYKCT